MTLHGPARRGEKPGRIIPVLVTAVIAIFTIVLLVSPCALSSTGWSAPENISGTLPSNAVPQIALDAGGNPHVTWYGWDGSTQRIYYSENTGGGWSAPVNISTTSTSNNAPQIALDALNHPHVTWNGKDALSVDRIYYSAYNGSVWSTPVNISGTLPTSPTANYAPQIALDALNHPHVTWNGKDALSVDRIYYSENTGGVWSTPENISDTFLGYSPEIALDAGGNPHVTWFGWDGSTARVYYSAYTGGVWSTPENISGTLPTSPTGNKYPQIALDALNHPHVTWNGSDGTTRIYYSAIDTYTISASASPPAGGTVSGDGPYTYGDTVQMWATPNSNYHFVNWTEGGTQVSTDPHYQFTITSDRTLVGNFDDTQIVKTAVIGGQGTSLPSYQYIHYGDTATINITPATGYHIDTITDNGNPETPTNSYVINNVTEAHSVLVAFAINIDTYTINVSVNPAGSGTVTGAGTYNYGDTATLSATPNTGYHFVKWTEGGYESFDNPLSFTVKSDHNGVANFALDTHTISASANPVAGGTVSGDGTYNYDDTVTMGATPSNGYHFVNWTENGNEVSTDPNYQFTATADRTLVGNFSNVYNIQVYAVSVGGKGGTVTGSGNYSPSEPVTIHAAPDPGFHFINWTENGTKISTDPNYSFTATSDRTITGNFAINTYTVTASVSGDHGNVTPPTQTVNYGSNATVTITPDTDYHVETITDNGVQETFTNQYVINNVTADHNVVVTFGINISAFYFAEGTTRDNFAEYLCIGNPNGSDTSANVTYMFSDGTTKDVKYTLPAKSRYTVNVNDAVGPDKDVSIRILSSAPNLVAERPMYFNYKGVWTGGSDALGAIAPTPNLKWYFAEGNTLPEFDQYVTVLNPGDVSANLTFHYMVEGQGEKTATGTVGAHSRATFKTKDQIGAGLNDSLYLESDQLVVAERPMYFNYQGLAGNNWTGGSDAAGTNSPNTDWYFAEGTTRDNSIDGAFEQWLCLQNPSASPIAVNATYQLAAGQGGPVSKSYTIPAQQRLTVSVNREIGADKDCSVHLHSSSGFIAERPMYFSYHPYAWTGGHDVLGANGTAKTWFFAEGTTRQNGTDGTFDEWLCLQNPSKDEAHVVITYYLASGQTINKNWTVNANTRLTVSANSDVGADQDISAKITSDQPIIAERPMYFNYHNVWTGGHDVVGFVPTQ